MLVAGRPCRRSLASPGPRQAARRATGRQADKRVRRSVEQEVPVSTTTVVTVIAGLGLLAAHTAVGQGRRGRRHSSARQAVRSGVQRRRRRCGRGDLCAGRDAHVRAGVHPPRPGRDRQGPQGASCRSSEGHSNRDQAGAHPRALRQRGRRGGIVRTRGAQGRGGSPDKRMQLPKLRATSERRAEVPPRPLSGLPLGAGAAKPSGGTSGMKRVTGLGGVFFRSRDPKAALQWYRKHLGIESADWGGFAFQWIQKERPDEVGYTVWSAFPEDTEYFAPSQESFMVNFRVHDLGRLIAALEAEGIEIVGEIEQHENGKFAWILDPEGRKIELWEPVPSKDDPYL